MSKDDQPSASTSEHRDRKRTRQLISEQCAGRGKTKRRPIEFNTYSSPGRISTNTTTEQKEKKKAKRGEFGFIVPLIGEFELQINNCSLKFLISLLNV